MENQRCRANYLINRNNVAYEAWFGDKKNFQNRLKLEAFNGGEYGFNLLIFRKSDQDFRIHEIHFQ